MKRFLLTLFLPLLFISCLTEDDDVIIVCQTPTQITATNITDTSLTVTWNNGNAVRIVSIEYGLQGFEIGTGTEVTTYENSLTVTNLTPNTAYDFYITSECSADNISMTSNATTLNTDYSPVVAEFLPNLSELNLFIGDLKDLTISPKTFEYDLSTPLFTDYAHKLRTIALPQGTSLEYQDDGFPIFPNGTVISKTFYYNLDETNPNSERLIIETRVLIRKNDAWEINNYVWNEEQTEAVLDENQHDVKVDFKNEQGDWVAVDYVVPANNDCIKCHSNSGNVVPIGPKLRTMNFDVDGINQLQKFINEGHLTGAPSPTTIGALPNWEDDANYTLEERARAYFDVNCAHCHEPGGFCIDESTLDLRYETNFNDTNIYERRFSISVRMSAFSPGTSMPFIGVTMVHSEGYQLIQEYLDTLD